MNEFATVGEVKKVPYQPEHNYPQFSAAIRESFAAAVATGGRMFQTELLYKPPYTNHSLFDIFLACLPEEHRQHYNCHCCHAFINVYGTLVTIDPESGRTMPAMWTNVQVSEFFQPAVDAMYEAVAKAKVVGVYATSMNVWGTPETGEWKHLSVEAPLQVLYQGNSFKTSGEIAAEKREDHGLVMRALDDFSLDTISLTNQVIKAGALNRSEKVAGVADWFLTLKQRVEATKNEVLKKNIVWSAVSTAPAGFAHVRNTVISSLLTDLQQGVPFDQAQRSFNRKMGVDVFQRPQAAPTAGAIQEAERTFAKMGAQASLRRRAATVADLLELFWSARPAPQPSAATGLFGHLKPKDATPAAAVRSLNLPPQTITWAKFARDILPDAEVLEFYAQQKQAAFVMYATAADPTAPPIIQWDMPEKRNPVSTFQYMRGSYPAQWGINAGTYVKVYAIATQPHEWCDTPVSNQASGIALLLEGAKHDGQVGASCLFPEILKSEFHGVRSVIEAYSNSTPLEGTDIPNAAIGISVNNQGVQVRVTSRGVTAAYFIDRLE